MNDIKPGMLTTEFWVTLLTNVWGTVALFGGFNVDDSTANSVIKVAALVASAVASGWYAHSRGKVKSSNVGTVIAPAGNVSVDGPPDTYVGD